jgi:hypothetical protein
MIGCGQDGHLASRYPLNMAAGFLFPLLVLFTTNHRLIPPIELPTKNNSPQADQKKAIVDHSLAHCLTPLNGGSRL